MREFSGSASPYATYSTTTYGYDVPGSLVDVWDNAGNNTHMVYDAFGRKSGMSDPDMGTWGYKYDAAGNLTEQLDARNTRLCFIYDTLDRLTYKRHDHDGNGCASTYTQLAQYIYFTTGTGRIGKPSEIRWSSSSSQNRETFNYDSLGRLTTHIRYVDSRAYTMSYGSFDPFHRPTSTTYPDGEVVSTGFDHEGANSLTAGSNGLVSNLTYNARGQLALLERYAANTTYLYHPQNDAAGGGTGDSSYRLKTIQHGVAGTGNPWPDFTYQYDKVGNITRMITVNTDGTDTQTFIYDHRDRLTSAVATGNVANYNQGYTYNAIGNMTSNAGNGYTYSSSHKHAVAEIREGQYNTLVTAFSYDANGNMTFRDNSGTANDYTQNFNVENELSSVVNNGSTTSFTYDAAGIRVKTVKPNGTIIDHPFPGYEVENPTGTPIIRRTYFIAGQTIATRITGHPVGANNGLFFFYTDHLGSTSMLHKSGQSVPFTGSTTRYYPFGGYRGPAPSQAITDRDFTGQRENMELGLLYYNARYYLPGVGRFLSADTLVPDPANPQSYNRYSYTLNNPLRYTDPTGHCGADNQMLWDPDKGSYTTVHFPQTDDCIQLRDTLEGLYNISITGLWTLNEMELFRDSLQGIRHYPK